MNCRTVEPLLSRHLDDRLTAPEAEAVAAHLDQCPACRRRREEFGADGAALRSLAALPPPPDVERLAVERWMAGRAARGWSWRWRRLRAAAPGTRDQAAGTGIWRWMPHACGAAVLLLVLLGLTREHRQHHPQQGSPLPSMPPRSDHRIAAVAPPAVLPLRQDAGSRMGQTGSQRRSGAASSPSTTPSNEDRRQRSRRHRLPSPGGVLPIIDDLQALNDRPAGAASRGASRRQDETERLEARVRRQAPSGDEFVQIPFPRLAALSHRQVAAAADRYRREAAVVDPRLARKVTLQQKATALSDLCDRLRAETGIQLTAGRSVADEKVTVFCREMPLREVMRQLSRPFGYAWVRSGKEGEYRYELLQDLRSQLLEEELRNRDRHEALLALEKDINRFRPYLELSPDEALARSRNAAPGDKPLLQKLAGREWGPLHMYFRLSAQELAALRAGQELKFREAPRPGEQPRPDPATSVLPPEIGQGVLQSLRHRRLIQTEVGWEYTPEDGNQPGTLPPAAIPEARGEVRLQLDQSDLGQFTISGASGVFTIGKHGGIHWYGSNGGSFGSGASPTARNPRNAAANARLARDPSLRARVIVRPQPSPNPSLPRGAASEESAMGERKVTAADVLEALHRATGTPVVADYFTRLYPPGAVTARNQPLFDALNQLGDTMRLRWHKEGDWLQFRSTTYYDDRLKEVPNRLLTRWSDARRQHGALRLDDVVEIAQLPDAPLDAAEMAEGAREYWGLAEWDLARQRNVRPHLRYLATFTPAQRQETMSAAGLLFARMSLAQQRQYIALGVSGRPLQSLDELNGATLRVDYTRPGGFQWGAPGWPGYPTRWVIPFGPGRQDRRVPRPPVVARTREEALAAVRRIDPQLREQLLEAVRRSDPSAVTTPLALEEEQIFPTQRDLTFIYIPSATNARAIYVLNVASGTDGYF